VQAVKGKNCHWRTNEKRHVRAEENTASLCTSGGEVKIPWYYRERKIRWKEGGGNTQINTPENMNKPNGKVNRVKRRDRKCHKGSSAQDF